MPIVVAWSLLGPIGAGLTLFGITLWVYSLSQGVTLRHAFAQVVGLSRTANPKWLIGPRVLSGLGGASILLGVWVISRMTIGII